MCVYVVTESASVQKTLTYKYSSAFKEH